MVAAVIRSLFSALERRNQCGCPVSGCALYSGRPGTGGFWGPGAAQGRGPDLREDQSLRPCGAVWCILVDWLVTQTENAGRKRLDATVISRLEKRPAKKIEPFRKFQCSDTFFKPGLDILTRLEERVRVLKFPERLDLF